MKDSRATLRMDIGRPDYVDVGLNVGVGAEVPYFLCCISYSITSCCAILQFFNIHRYAHPFAYDVRVLFRICFSTPASNPKPAEGSGSHHTSGPT